MKRTPIVIALILTMVLIGLALSLVRRPSVVTKNTPDIAPKTAPLVPPTNDRANLPSKNTLVEKRGKRASTREELLFNESAPGDTRQMRPSNESEEEREREREGGKRAKKGRYAYAGPVASFAAQSGPNTSPAGSKQPTEDKLRRAGKSFDGDLRNLPQTRPVKRERPEREDPKANPRFFEPLPGITKEPSAPSGLNSGKPQSVLAPAAPAPAPIANFDGLDFASWGAGHPPDTNGDVGPDYYIQAINTSIGVYRKSDSVRVAAFTFNTFMSQGNFGNLCDTNNFGDPIVLYDTFEDRWVISDFAFQLDGSSNVVNPPGAFQCFAVSRTSDPVAGGWNYYSINTTGGLGDYPKIGIWPDGLYMSVNMFGYPAGAAFQNPRVYALNKAQMYAGSPTVQVVSFNAPAADFALLPSNARLQTGTPPAGTPNYFVSTWQFLNALTVYKFHVDWNNLSLSTFTGPDQPLAATSWPNAAVPNAPSQGGNSLDVLQIRAMMQNQYSNIGGVESLWTSHTVRRGNTTGFAAPRWYQVNVTGGTVAANIPQAATWDPDAANVIHRFMPSVAVNRMGDLALGYSTSSSTTKPALKYAGRLATDPLNTLGQTEQVLIQGTGTQTGSCGGTCSRWGDYSAMTLDPNGCTFWYTNMYYAADGLNHQTRIGSFSFPGCTQVGGGGTVAGTVTATVGGAPISGATVALGSRTTTTNGAGFYQFLNIPAGTYPSITASAPGYNSSTATNIVVTDGATTTQDFSLGVAPAAGCLTDTTQADFQTGVATNVELATSPGDVKLANGSVEGADQVSSPAALSTTNNLTATAWTGQTFRAGITGNLTKITVGLGLASGTSGTITVEIRNLNGSNPGTTVLATGTLGPVTNVGTAALYTTTFATPAAVVSGTSYSVVLRTSVGSTVFGVRGSTAGGSTLANGQVFTTTNSGTTWTGIAADLYFTTFVTPPFAYTTSGNFVSGTKDANPATGATPHWTTLSWTATIPANTDLKLQVAGSNSVNGPFNFVGPDGTAATFFTTSSASLSQFDGFRYLQYKAYLSTTDTNATPTLSDVTVCFSNITGVVAGGGAICAGGSTNVTVTVSGGTAPYTVILTNGGGTQTGAGPVFTFPVSPGSDTTYALAAGSVDANANPIIGSGSATVTVTPTPPTPTITPGGPTTFCAGGSVTLTSSSATGNQWYLNGNPIGGATNQTYVATASGNYTVVVTASGCSSAPSTPTTVTVNPSPPTPTITPGGPTTFCAGGSVTLTSSSATGNQWYLNGNPIGGATNQTYVATASGDYTVVVTASGCSSAPSAPTTVTVNPTPPTPTITPGGPTTFCAGGSVTLTSSSATGNQWYLNGNPIGGATNQTYVATASGNYTVVVTASGCSSAPSAPTTVTVNPIPPTPTITPSGPQSLCAAGSVLLMSSSATGNQWYLNGNPIGGATNQTYSATAAGSYTVIVTTSGCSSAPSVPTVVSANTPPVLSYNTAPVTAGTTPTIPPATGPSDNGTITSIVLQSIVPASGLAVSVNNVTGQVQVTGATLMGSYTVTIVATDNCNATTTAPLTVNVTCPTITVNPASLPGGTLNTGYNQTVSATPGGTTYSFAVTSGALPNGLTLNPTSGAITGAPTQTGTFNFRITATGFGGCPGFRDYTLVVTCPTITLDPASLPNAGIGAGYSQTVSATPAGTYNYGVTSGALPTGLSLNTSTGAITGTPTATGTFNFRITATGAGGCTGFRDYAIVVTCPSISLTPASLPNGVAGTSYNQTVSATPAGTYNYAVTTGALPTGLSLNPTTGVISGTPSAAGNFAFVITAGFGTCTGSQSYNLLITGTCSAITLSPTSLPAATVGTAYNQTLTATGGTAPYTFTVSSGALPAGLSLDSGGALTGTSTTGGTFAFTLKATGQGGCFGTRNYVITVACATLTFSPASLPNGTIGQSYNQTLTVAPAGAYTFSILLGQLPLGYTMNSAGVISGITNQLGTFNFTVKVLGGSCQATKAYTLTIAASSVALVQKADYDGDGQSDFALWGNNGTWRLSLSNAGSNAGSNGGANRLAQTLNWGLAGDVSLLGDYDGDGKTDLAVFRPANSTWYIRRSSDGGFLAKAWGAASDVPVPGDYDGDGKTDLAVFRPSEGNWYVLRSTDQQTQVTAWGAGYAPYNDVAVPGDYDGDGKTDLAVFRRATGTWLVKRSSDGQFVAKQWGATTDMPVAADFDGDGLTDFAVWRVDTWYIWQSATASSRLEAWGSSAAPFADQAVPGDYDGDGKADIAVWRAGGQTWYVRCSLNGSVMMQVQGQAGDRPLSSVPR